MKYNFWFVVGSQLLYGPEVLETVEARAKEMAEEYGISSRKAASILDTFSCIFQGVIPYGAQMLVAISAAAELGHEISAFDIMPHLLYPYLLLVSSLIFMFVIKEKRANN